MPESFLAIGSNLGDRARNLETTVRRLRAEPGVRVTRVSRFYETTPVDCPAGSPDFLNAAVAIETDRPPAEVLSLCQRIEQQLGRVRDGRNAPRTIDIDILLHADQIIRTPDLIIPHPRMHDRAFVLVPLAEIAAEMIHPVLGRAIGELASELPPPLPTIALASAAAGVLPLDGLRALVTGSTSGIGRAIADELQTRGAHVIRHGRSARVDEGAFIPADLRDGAGCASLAEAAWSWFDGLDIVVLNAGADTLTGEAASWPFERKLEELLAVDLTATMLLGRDLGGRMKRMARGSIVTMGWDQAETGMEGDSGQLFSAVKGAIACFTRSLALSLAPEVRVNCIAPGWIRTAWGETASPVWQERVRRETPLGRWGLAEDVAEAVGWLASPQAGFVTGQTIRVNGGAIR